MRGNRYNTALHLAVSAMAIIAAAGTASAQEQGATAAADTSEGVQEIVVTAQRRSESLLSVPLAVSAMSGDDLARRRITDPSSLSATIPNLQVNDQTGGAQPNFTLRGIGLGNEFSDNQLSPIGFYVNDAYVVSRGSQGGQLFDLDRVEVLRGPQGTLYGRNTTGGAINIITRKPKLKGINGYVQAGYGNFDDVRAQGAIEFTPVEDVFGIRLAADFARHDAYFENIFPGQPDVQSGNSLTGRISVRLKASEDLEFNLMAFASRSRFWQPANYVLGTAPDGTNPFTGYTRGSLGFFKTDTDLPLKFNNRARGGQFTARYQLTDELSVQSISFYDTAKLYQPQEADGSPVNLVLTYFDSKQDAFNQELRLSYESDAFKVQGGLFYGWDRITVDNRYLLFGFLEDLGVPADPTLHAGGASILQNYTQTRRSKAIFGQADYRLTDRLTATLGLRYTRDTGRYAGTAFIGDYDFVPLVQTVGLANGDPYRNAGKNSALTGRGALEYSLPGGGVVYASYSRGYRAGSFNGGAYFDNAQTDYIRPEKVNAYEAGVKTKLFGGTTTLAAAAFYYDYSDQQLSEVRGVSIFLDNAGKSTIKGLEFELTSRLTRRFTLRTNLGLLDTQYDELFLEAGDQLDQNGNPVLDQNGNPVPIINNLKGNRLPFTPKVTLSAGFDWTIMDAGDWRATFSPTLNYISKTYFTPYNNRGNYGMVKDNGYAVLDATLTVENGPWSLSIWGRNLTQSRYFVSGNNLDGFGYINLFQGNPRTFGALLKRSF